MTTTRQPEIDELIKRLDLSLVEPDPDYDTDEDSEATASPQDRPESVNNGRSSGSSSSSSMEKLPAPSSSSREVPNQQTSTVEIDKKEPNKSARDLNGTKSTSPVLSIGNRPSIKSVPTNGRSEVTAEAKERPVDAEDKKSNGRFDFIRKLRGGSSESSSSSSAKTSNRRKTLERLKVDSLPQSFVAKYVGCKACRGLWGIQFTREPVDALVDDLRRLDRSTGDRRDDLPLVRIDVTSDGLAIAVHPRNRSSRPISDIGLLPLEFISYAVQDTRYSRIFAFVLVRELSSRARATECHAFLCDAPVTARTLALSAALAFKAYEQKLAGRPFKFVVDLRWPDELETELNEAKQQQQQQTSATGPRSASYPRAEFEV